jgi:tetratricopeptide (TPR) repeat protein
VLSFAALALLTGLAYLPGLRGPTLHFVNLALHIVATLLLYQLLRRWHAPLPWLAAAAWGIHPVNVATVASIVEQKSTVAMTLALATALAFTRFLETKKKLPYFAAIVLMAGSTLSNSAAALLPVLLAIYIWWRTRMLRPKDVALLVPIALAAWVPLFLAFLAQSRAPEMANIAAMTAVERVVNASLAIRFFVREAFWPTGLMVIYPKWNLDPSLPRNWLAITGVALVLVAIIIAVYFLHARGLVTLVAAFVLLIAPVIGVIRMGYWYASPVADHWAYFALPALMVVGAWVVAQLARLPRTTAASLVLAIFFWLAWNRTALYADEVELWRDNATKNPTSDAVYHNLAAAYLDAGQLAEAESAAAKAVYLAPNDWTASQAYADVLRRRGKVHAAIREYERALRLQPNRAEEVERLIEAIRRSILPSTAPASTATFAPIDNTTQPVE